MPSCGYSGRFEQEDKLQRALRANRIGYLLLISLQSSLCYLVTSVVMQNLDLCKDIIKTPVNFLTLNFYWPTCGWLSFPLLMKVTPGKWGRGVWVYHWHLSWIPEPPYSQGLRASLCEFVLHWASPTTFSLVLCLSFGRASWLSF